jgi:hypothetical protein
MKRTYVFVLAVAVAAYCVPAFAQHGHGPGGPSGMGSANGMGGASHATAGANNAGTHGSSAAASNGKTMDQLLTQNTKLSDKIASLTGESAQQSCTGFKNLGQCVAAAHVSKNLGISFDCLKSDITGTAAPTGSNCPGGPSTTAGTGTKTMSLGKAIQTLSPTVNSKTEAKKGQQQANQDLKDSTNNS